MKENVLVQHIEWGIRYLVERPTGVKLASTLHYEVIPEHLLSNRIRFAE